MEISSCLKAVLSTANHYKSNPTDESTFSYFLRQLDVLIEITSKKTPVISLHSEELLLNQCFAVLISFISNAQIKFILAQKILSLFNNFVSSVTVHPILQHSFDLFDILLDYFKTCLTSSNNSNLLLCIKVLQKLTYKQQMTISITKVEVLLDFLLNQLECYDTDGIKYYLGLLSNLTLKTPIVQSFVKSKDNLKAILKKLMGFMSNENHKIQIFAITILSNLCLHDEVGNKIFKGQNLFQMFHFLFNVLHISKPGTTQQYAVDLFINITSNQRICDQLVEYPHLPQCLQLVTSNITSSSLHIYRAVLELLSSFSSVPKLRNHIHQLMFNNQRDSSINIDSLLTQESSCLFTCLVIAILKEDQFSSISELCLDLLTSLYSGSEVKLERLDILVAVLVKVLTSYQPSDCTKSLKHLKSINLLKMTSSAAFALQDHLDVDSCLRLIHAHINCLDDNFLNTSLLVKSKKAMLIQPTKLSSFDEDKKIQEKPCHELVLQLYDFLITHHHADKRVHDILKDSRFMPFIAKGLTSQTKSCTHASLKILSLLKFDQLSFNLLVDLITQSNQECHNSQQKTNFCTNSSFLEIPSPLNPHDKRHSHMVSMNSEVNNIVSNLIERIKHNTEIKDLKTSEIISIYEFKLQEIQGKENVIQGLLDAKSEALNQSERVLSHLKLRLAQYETEAQGLRLLLLDSEKRKDDLSDKANRQANKIDSLQGEYDAMLHENNRLNEIETKFKALNLDFSALSQKYESCQRSHESLRQDHEALVEMDEMLKKRHESLRGQNDELATKLTKVEDEKSSLGSELKERNQQNTELSRTLKSCKEGLKKKSTECEELESTMEKLQTELSRSAQSNKELRHQISSLELLCLQRETSIKEKEALMQQQRKELDKYMQAAALFHKLTSGLDPGVAP